MSNRQAAILVSLLFSLTACGGQVVEFADDGGHVVADGGPDATPGPDARLADSGVPADADLDLPPEVVASIPAPAATGVSPGDSVFATFSKSMDASTITTSTFLLKQGATAVAGAVSLDAATDTATFNPTASLMPSTTYTATITTGALDTGGLALVADHTWSFTTAASGVAPTVVLVKPANLATNVSINARLTATFSRAMDPTTINNLTFTVAQGLNPVAGTVSYNAATNTATFTPASPLGLDMPYTATISTGAKDTGGAALASSFVWSFRTGACSQGPVALGSAVNFVVLAGSTITSTGPTSVTGDIGVSPGTAVTGFPPGILVGSKHAGDPTSALGIADLTIAYNDAAGRTLCPVTVSGNLGGMTLAPGLYKSTSSLAVSSGNLTLDAKGDGQAVFIFQMASTLTATSGRRVILINGAKAANVFWQVGTSATLGTTSSFQGTIMADQAITLGTGARLTGRALARIAAVNLDSTTIVKPAP